MFNAARAALEGGEEKSDGVRRAIPVWAVAEKEAGGQLRILSHI